MDRLQPDVAQVMENGELAVHENEVMEPEKAVKINQCMEDLKVSYAYIHHVFISDLWAKVFQLNI